MTRPTNHRRLGRLKRGADGYRADVWPAGRSIRFKRAASASVWHAGRTTGGSLSPEHRLGERGPPREHGHAIIPANDQLGPTRPPPEATPIDIIFLVERLESIIANGRRLPLTNNVVIDQAAALGLIDELRVAVPEEVRAAKRINSEGERIIEKAQEEAERIVARAQEQAAFLIDERGLTQQAEAESRRIIGESQDEAEEVRRGADEYAVSVLVGLEGEVVKTLQSIKKGISLLDERRAELPAETVPEEGWTSYAEDVDDDAEEDASLPVQR
jgi:F0F1-type ATP synthase membrane subunit b/b'